MLISHNKGCKSGKGGGEGILGMNHNNQNVFQKISWPRNLQHSIIPPCVNQQLWWYFVSEKKENMQSVSCLSFKKWKEKRWQLHLSMPFLNVKGAVLLIKQFLNINENLHTKIHVVL